MLPPNWRVYDDMEFLAEHFGFLPVHVSDAIYDACNAVVYLAIEGLEQYLVSINGMNPKQLHDELGNFEQKLESVMDSSFNIFEQYLFDNVLKLPKDIDITLDHHKDLKFDYTAEDEALLDLELEKARRAVMAQEALQYNLEVEIDRLDKQIQTVDEYKNSLAFLTKIAREQKVFPTKDTMQLVAEQLLRLQELITENVQIAKSDRTWKNLQRADDRMAYLQRAVQKQLDTLRQVSPSH
ncbi:uncharacterized protein BYT42DRAFT_556781 [Radiomyces spectabilis]|uniref:uncharacterized protein n=1 Tax=Radiomyces spectabilis TaxID=64574 RepID=UPI00221E8384|nr:uncharacterized protein BYT42DRAFT_556781 [Radiomyces spectabilis]KAI8391409.1 hypothetical protein BYT42DRAFT_556781 [Radiomyces spectabilis]